MGNIVIDISLLALPAEIRKDWKIKYPGHEDKLRVSEELAEKTSHQSSGFSDSELQKRTDELVEKLEDQMDDMMKQDEKSIEQHNDLFKKLQSDNTAPSTGYNY